MRAVEPRLDHVVADQFDGGKERSHPKDKRPAGRNGQRKEQWQHHADDRTDIGHEAETSVRSPQRMAFVCREPRDRA